MENENKELENKELDDKDLQDVNGGMKKFERPKSSNSNPSKLNSKSARGWIEYHRR